MAKAFHVNAFNATDLQNYSRVLYIDTSKTLQLYGFTTLRFCSGSKPLQHIKNLRLFPCNLTPFLGILLSHICTIRSASLKILSPCPYQPCYLASILDFSMRMESRRLGKPSHAL